MLTELGVFVSSILLSLGGCVAMTCGELRKSRCTQIKCSECMEIDRQILESESVAVPAQ